MADMVKMVQNGSCRPGGVHCPCCAPHPNDRKAFDRRVRKIVKRLMDKIDRLAWGE